MSLINPAHRARFALLLALLTVLPTAGAGDDPVLWAQSDEKRFAITAILLEKALSEGPQRVMIGLNTAFKPEGSLSRAGFSKQRQDISSAQSAVLAGLAGFNIQKKRQFKYVPFMVLEADTLAIERLADLPMVASLQEDQVEHLAMASSNEVIGSPAAWSAGYDGTDWVVAVLDTGVDKTHPYFTTGSKVVSEACYSTTLTDLSTTVCPNGEQFSVALGSGVNCPLDINGCDHGTHVAGSATGNDLAGPNYGVGRGAKIIAIQVFSSIDSDDFCGIGNSPCAGTFPSDQVAALERVYDLRGDFNIAAVNMSLGGTIYTDEVSCDDEQQSRKLAIDNLRSVGIATVAASGNSGRLNGIRTPACISSSVSVGATTDLDSIAGFSNVADFLDLLAPGFSITSAAPGGGTSNMSGTSMATPHVAGAWAILKQRSPTAGVARVLTVLRYTGTSVDDGRTNGTVTDMRRINVDVGLARLADIVLFEGFEGD